MPIKNLSKAIFSLSIICIAFACGGKAPTTGTSPALTAQERFYCDSLGIDSSAIIMLRAQTDSAVLPFPNNLEEILEMDIDEDSSKKNVPGFIFNTPYSDVNKIINSLSDDLDKMGYTIFCLDRNFGYNKKADVVGILKSTDKYQILRQVGTDGINWGIDNDSLLRVIKKFDEKYSLQLVGAAGDWCEFKINKAPASWLAMAKEVNEICPDVVDQGTGTVEKLAEEMRQSGILFFWWD